VDDHNWKSTEELIHRLIDIISKGGNYLLNVGPTADGIIPQPSADRLLAMGDWLQVNGEAVYGTEPGPLQRLGWGRSTAKPGRIYLHVFYWPRDGEISLPVFGREVCSAHLLSDPSRTALPLTRQGGRLSIKGPSQAPDPINTVLVLEVER
jgi:alpha-L-fucosidase